MYDHVTWPERYDPKTSAILEELGRKYPGALYRYHQERVESLARTAEAQVAKTAG